jgi:hypothetical protein
MGGGQVDLLQPLEAQMLIQMMTWDENDCYCFAFLPTARR